MRRYEREITDFSKINEIMDKCLCCHLGLNDDGQVYIVPINFGYECKNGKYTIYFHSAAQGRKIDIIRKNPKAGFEMDTNCEIKLSETACKCSACYQSVIGSGTISIIEDKREKIHGLDLLMKHCTGRENCEFSLEALKAVCVFKLEVLELCRKEKINYSKTS